MTKQCPYCQKEMQQGYVISNGARLMFSNQKHKFVYSDDNKNNEVMLSIKHLGAYKEAYRCIDCKTIILEY